jgi:hypothetical protein
LLQAVCISAHRRCSCKPSLFLQAVAVPASRCLFLQATAGCCKPLLFLQASPIEIRAGLLVVGEQTGGIPCIRASELLGPTVSMNKT